MSELLFNPKTKQLLDKFIASPVHALLLEGPTGSGKTATIQWLAAQLLSIDESKLANHPYVLSLVADDKQTISIDSIRKLNHFLSLKVPSSKSQVQRLVLIDDADNMTAQAQNALLKNLEEPVAGSIFILTTSNVNNLLPTIKSRLRLIRLAVPSLSGLRRHLTALAVEEPRIEQIIAISGGLPGLAVAIATNQDHHLLKAAELAKDILTKDSYGRLAYINKIHQDKKLVKDMLSVIQQMASISLKNNRGAQADKWKTILEGAYQAEIDLDKKANAKLVLSNFLLKS